MTWHVAQLFYLTKQLCVVYFFTNVLSQSLFTFCFGWILEFCVLWVLDQSGLLFRIIQMIIPIGSFYRWAKSWKHEASKPKKKSYENFQIKKSPVSVNKNFYCPLKKKFIYNPLKWTLKKTLNLKFHLKNSSEQ